MWSGITGASLAVYCLVSELLLPGHSSAARSQWKPLEQSRAGARARHRVQVQTVGDARGLETSLPDI